MSCPKKKRSCQREMSSVVDEDVDRYKMVEDEMERHIIIDDSGSEDEREIGNLTSTSSLSKPTLSFSAAIKAAGLTFSMSDVDQMVQEQEKKRKEEMTRERIYPSSSI